MIIRLVIAAALLFLLLVVSFGTLISSVGWIAFALLLIAICVLTFRKVGSLLIQPVKAYLYTRELRRQLQYQGQRGYDTASIERQIKHNIRYFDPISRVLEKPRKAEQR